MSARRSRRISPLRLLGVLAVTGAVGAGGTAWSISTVERTFATRNAVWYAPYVDVSLAPVLHFEDPLENPAEDVVLGFVVADPKDGCEPTWGTYYDLDAAGRALDLDRRVARLRERGGDVVVSFGGAINQELARTCTDVDELVGAYRSVIDRYQVDRVDFDLEGETLHDLDAGVRRAKALAVLQAELPQLQVWVTLPVAPSGLDDRALGAIDTLLGAGVRLAGVNVMTMNYGSGRVDGQSMAEATEAALEATFQQTAGALQRAGITATSAEVWAMIGATPMIGQNDVPSDSLTLDDGKALVAFAQQRRLGRLSMWSVNRDKRCGVQVDGGRVSNVCSGVEQEDAAFGLLFNDATLLSADDTPATATSSATERQSVSQDDTTSSPYPLWRASKAYLADDKVVWHGNVYQAKWWTQDELPDAPVAQLWDTPWRYLGPVLPGDAELTAAARPNGTKDAPEVDADDAIRWTPDRVFTAGDDAVLDGEVYRAKWWTQGDEPQIDPDSPFDHPWEYLGRAAVDEDSRR